MVNVPLGSGREGIDPRFFHSSNISDFTTASLVATLLGVWHYRVSARAGWSGVTIFCDRMT